jgi:hypothetical protein|tara:strand:- start:227 stop:436 length:210 start_codon:yes stop_codon:yes gene_type:complete
MTVFVKGEHSTVQFEISEQDILALVTVLGSVNHGNSWAGIDSSTGKFVVVEDKDADQGVFDSAWKFLLK